VCKIVELFFHEFLNKVKKKIEFGGIFGITRKLLVSHILISQFLMLSVEHNKFLVDLLWEIQNNYQKLGLEGKIN
jgi:hypothetical protein